MQLCDVSLGDPAGEPTATDTDPAPWYNFAGQAPLPGGGQSLWDGGTLTFPADTAGTGGTDKTHRAVAALLTAPLPVCDNGQVTVTASVDVENLGPSKGFITDGYLKLGLADGMILAVTASQETPAGAVRTLTVTAAIDSALLAAGQGAVYLDRETYDEGSQKTWEARNFTWAVLDAPDPADCVVPFLRTVITDCATGTVLSTVDTDLDGNPYTVQGTAGPCDTGSALTLDPDPCNAAQTTDGGLLVPRAVLEGVGSGGAAGPERSVDIDVTETPGCPDTWAVGARLAMVSDFVNAEGQHQNLLAQVGQDVPVPASDIVLPEAGVYHVDADVRYALGTETGGSGYLLGWLQDETTGQLLTSFTQLAAINSPAGQEHQGGTAHLMTEYAASTGPRTVRLHLMAVETGGTLSAAEAGGSDSNGATRVRLLKIRD
ncbi:hypothetical protein [Streptomyces sp. NPDC007346]|uniref:hypothetical protein n=1 Tax=Streptomyces sp. NPDC007346 TaxID=3154682 RepID=UPI003452F926